MPKEKKRTCTILFGRSKQTSTETVNVRCREGVGQQHNGLGICSTGVSRRQGAKTARARRADTSKRLGIGRETQITGTGTIGFD